MKKIFLLFSIAIATGLIFSCGNDDNGGPQKTATELAIEKLAGEGSGLTWTVSNGGSVSRDGTSQTATFSQFEITFRSSSSAGRTYSTTGSTGLFDPSGTWSIEGENNDKLRLVGIQAAANVPINFSPNAPSPNSINDLRLDFTISAPVSGRVSGLVGYYVFDLKLKN
ncbi:MAG TPA: hypothetical protein VK957_10950 [Lunatimonas sp.]|nr:hypothetical protein [Lunatimonas sp.]